MLNRFRSQPHRSPPPLSANPIMSQSVICPTCGEGVNLQTTASPPFCSRRCQMIDLGRWLDEDIGVPFEVDKEGRQVEAKIGEEEERD